MPMFINKSYNWVLFSGFLFYFVADICYKSYNKCITSLGEFCFNIGCGALISSFVVLPMITGGSSIRLFFNQVQSSKETCSQPSKQQFKCDVYKNGQLVQTL
jgi:hypothetical protein